MATELRVGAPLRAEGSPSTVVARQTARRAVRSGIAWGYVFGVAVASSAFSYTEIYKTRADRERLAASFGSNHAASALFGPAPQLQTVAGFTVFKTSMTLMVIGAVWGLLTSTRLLRGEEDSGRWEILLTGQSTVRGALVQGLAGLTAGIVALWTISALITVIAGLSRRVDIAAGPGLYLALTLVSTAVIFLAVGAVTSQLAPTRRQAAALAATVLGVSYAVRMVGDSGIGLHWLVWLSPLGWVEELRPLTSPQPLALLPIAGLTAGLGAAAVYLAGRRDVGSSILPDHATARPRLRLLRGPTGLTVRLVRSTAVGWVVAVALAGLVTGVVARAAGSSMSGSSVQRVFARLGAPGEGADAFLGVAFLIMAVMIGFAAAGQVVAARLEEAEGRLEHLLVQPMSRAGWFAGRLVVAASLLIVCGIAAGISAWVGAASRSSGVRFGAALGAGLNVVPPSLLLLGVGALAIGVWPRRASLVVHAVLVWSLLVVVLGGFATQSHWLLDTSVFHQMAAAPAASPHWRTNGAMAALAAAGMAVGGVLFVRRDIEGE